jgi:hypothetical protein
MTDLDYVKRYIDALLEAGLNVPAEVLAALERMCQRQLKDHGK